jgi:hypothetical protein
MPPGKTLIKEEEEYFFFSSSFFLSFFLSSFSLLLLFPTDCVYLPEAILPLKCQKEEERKMVELDDEKESGKKKTRKGVGRGGGRRWNVYIYI